MLKVDTPSYHNESSYDRETLGSDHFVTICEDVMASLHKNVSPTDHSSLGTIFTPVGDFDVEESRLENDPWDSMSDCGDQCDEYITEDFYEHVQENLTYGLHASESLTKEGPNDLGSEPQNAEIFAQDKAPLYPSAKVTVGSTIVLLVLFSIKYNMAADAIGHLLSLLTLILPSGHVLPTSLNTFKNYFRNLRNPLVFHYYCSFCLSYVANSKNQTVSPNGGCLKDLTVKGALSYFVEIPILHQLRSFFARDTFYDDIQHRFTRVKSSDDVITDIYDGLLYKELCEKGILNCKDNISFLMNTDGVPVFKSSKVSIWPVYLIINELPNKKRMARENMLFSGLWFGERKPAMLTFLKPYCESLRDLESGIELEAPKRGRFTCKGVVVSWTCDLPARCLVCNSMQFNGEFGCCKCLQQGKTVKSGKGHVRAFPYQHEDPKGPPRNKDDTIRHAAEITRRQLTGEKLSNIKGVKGPSCLSFLEYYDLVRGIAIDYMHGVLLGVQKLLQIMV